VATERKHVAAMASEHFMLIVPSMATPDGDDAKGGGVKDTVEMTLSAGSSFSAVARLAASTVAFRAGFDIEEIEDLRLAVDELYLSVAVVAELGAVRTEIKRDDTVVVVTCSCDCTYRTVDDDRTDEFDDFAIRLIDALVDEHDREIADGRYRARVCKRGSGVSLQ
jgi:serine/threonine-protein kinase RsbW